MYVSTVIKAQEENNLIYKEVSGILKTFVEETKDSDARHHCENRIFSYLKEFQSLCGDFGQVHRKIKQQYETKLVGQYEMYTNKTLSELEKREIVENPQILREMCQKQLGLEVNVEVKNKFKDLENRHKEISAIESKLEKLHRMMIDLSVLVHDQGEIIDSIEQNVKRARGNVEWAEKDILESNELLKSARKKKCCILIIVLGVVGTILWPVISFIV